LSAKRFNVKKLIKNNFSESTKKYVEFEDKHAFFRSLARELIKFGDVKNGLYIDIGCGTGIIKDVAPELDVVGVDVSPDMVRVAREKIEVVLAGDAENLPFKDDIFDGAMFNASLFLIPNAEKAVEEAMRVVKSKGLVLASYLIGFFDGEEKVVEKYGLKHREVFPSEKIDVFADKFDGELLNVYYKVSGEFMKDFYLVPAMANALFPKIPYEERVKKIEETLKPLPAQVEFRCRILKIPV
jgi:ubiquinone/menaquinone biosynthesis C-methylase UbiE